jgi:hypothetical protein
MLRLPFPSHQISKLPKETKAQREEREKDQSKGVRCALCGGWHHKNAVHLDYVGHAALTDRLLDCDPSWNWEPIALTAEGLPALDRTGGLWIKLTVCGITRMGYGHAEGKHGGDAIKEIIGDALRNAAMRFGAALDLWHKGDLHLDDGQADDGADTSKPAKAQPRQAKPDPASAHEKAVAEAIDRLAIADTLDELRHVFTSLPKPIAADPRVIKAKDARKDALAAPAADLNDDIPEHLK